jgi:hypothetical protein
MSISSQWRGTSESSQIISLEMRAEKLETKVRELQEELAASEADYIRLREAKVDGIAQLSRSRGAKIEKLEAEADRVGPYVRAFYSIGAEIAKAGCCTHRPRDEVNLANCTRERLVVNFLAKRRELEGKS